RDTIRDRDQRDRACLRPSTTTITTTCTQRDNGKRCQTRETHREPPAAKVSVDDTPLTYPGGGGAPSYESASAARWRPHSRRLMRPQSRPCQAQIHCRPSQTFLHPTRLRCSAAPGAAAAATTPGTIAAARAVEPATAAATTAAAAMLARRSGKAVRGGVAPHDVEASKRVTAGSRGSGDPSEAVLPIFASGQRGRRAAESTRSTITAVGRVAGRAILARRAGRPARPTGATDEC